MNLLRPVYHEPKAEHRTMPDTTGKKIVFTDETHIIMHRFGSKQCRTSNSTVLRGLKLHAYYWWEYQKKEELYARFICPLGRHHYVEWQSKDRSWFACYNCAKDAPK